MIARLRPSPGAVGIVLLIALLIPPVRQTLEASMTAQMLVQIPLLAVAGGLLRDAVPQRMRAVVDDWNHGGITGLVLTTFAGACWMLPRTLDAAATEPLAAAAKFVSVPLCIGLAFALSWPRMGFVVRGVFLIELLASLFRLGWIYLASPTRLCTNYLLSDQQRLGRYLLIIGFLLLTGLVWKLLWGRFDPSVSGPRADTPSP